MDVNALRARASATWPCARDLVFQASELALSSIAHAVFAKLAPGRRLPTLEPVEGNTYDWGVDAAQLTSDGDGILVADYMVLDRERDDELSRTVHHVVVRDDACVTLETGSRPRWIAEPRLVVQVSSTAEAIDVVTDAILELALTLGLTFVERIDAPDRVAHPRRSSAAVRAFERVMTHPAHATAHMFAWFVIGMVPAWFDFEPGAFLVEPNGRGVDLVWTTGAHRARVGLSDSRNIHCIATDGATVVDQGVMSMHYTPSAGQYERARVILLCALRWLQHPVELPAEIVARIPAGRVFPTE